MQIASRKFGHYNFIQAKLGESALGKAYLMVVFFLNLNQFGNGLFWFNFLASISFFLMDLEDYINKIRNIAWLWVISRLECYK